MIVIKLMGGLGNQLQQYALYQKFIELGKEVYLDTGWFDISKQDGYSAPRKLELNLFEKADYQTASPEQISALLGPDGINASSIAQKTSKAIGRLAQKIHIKPNYYFVESGQYHPEIFEMKNAYLEGYWAAQKYYANVMPKVREKLAFTQINDANRIEAANIIQMACKPAHTCSVHVRRGDYLTPENVAMFGNIATENYYDEAFRVVRDRFPDTEFFIFSDDQDYVRSRYERDEHCHFVDINRGEDSRFDIYLMSQCDSHICANSTFSFWGARLDGKDGFSNNAGLKIRPTIHKNSQVFIAEEMKDIWAGWICIDPQGAVR